MPTPTADPIVPATEPETAAKEPEVPETPALPTPADDADATDEPPEPAVAKTSSRAKKKKRRKRRRSRATAAPEAEPAAEAEPAPEVAATSQAIDGVVIAADQDEEPEPTAKKDTSRPTRLGKTPIAEGFDE